MNVNEIDELPSVIEVNGFSYHLFITRPDGKWLVRYIQKDTILCQTSFKRFDKLEDAIEELKRWLSSLNY